MKISATQLEMALARLKYTIQTHTRFTQDLVVDIEFTFADPGMGQMVDALTLSACEVRPDDKEDRETKMTVEIYSALENQEPRATKTESFKVKDKYG